MLKVFGSMSANTGLAPQCRIVVALAMKLAVGAIVKVVCPYTAGDQNLEQRAEVRRRVPLVANERWLYGFRYLF